MKVICGIAGALLALCSGYSIAQASYPTQTVRILVGFSPGVAPDVTARLLADRLSDAWGKPVVVENVTGAGGNIGASRVAKALADGYTAELAAAIEREIPQWATVIKRAGIKAGE
jgi:tripartite-type tricarboxylate transporter receptor subunit TctC